MTGRFDVRREANSARLARHRGSPRHEIVAKQSSGGGHSGPGRGREDHARAAGHICVETTVIRPPGSKARSPVADDDEGEVTTAPGMPVLECPGQGGRAGLPRVRLKEHGAGSRPPVRAGASMATGSFGAVGSRRRVAGRGGTSRRVLPVERGAVTPGTTVRVTGSGATSRFPPEPAGPRGVPE